MTRHCRHRRRLVRHYSILACLSLAGGLLAAAATTRQGFQVLFVIAGFVGYLLNGSRATAVHLGIPRRRGVSPLPTRLAGSASWERPVGAFPASVPASTGAIAPIINLALHRNWDDDSPRSPHGRWSSRRAK